MDKEKIPLIEGAAGKSDPKELEWAFPEVDPGNVPLGGRILVQLKRTKKRAGKIVLVEETRETEKWNSQVAKVIALGPLAYKNRDTMQPWPEGSWAAPGDFVRVPKWGGDRWERKASDTDDGEDPVLFMVLNDHELVTRLTDDPLSFRAFV